MKIDVWILIRLFIYISCTVSFYINVSEYFQRIKTTNYDVLLKSEEFSNVRFGDFKDIEALKILKSSNDPYILCGNQTIDFVGCCLERQTLVTHLFDQKQIDNNFQILEIEDTFLTGECDVFYNDTLYQFCRLFYKKLQIIPFPAGNLTYFDHALHVYMSSPFQIGSFILETLSVVSLFPKDIIEKSTLILSEINPFVLDSLSTFGITEDHIHVKTHKEEIYYVHHLYSILPHQCNILNPESLSLLRSHFVKYFNLDQIPPRKYALNTLKNKPNELMNYEAVLSTFSENYPGIEWDVDGEPDNFSEILAYYNDIKLFFSCTTKKSVLTFMMQKGTVFCEIQGNFFDPLASHISAYLGHHHILARIPGMMLDKKTEPYELPLTTAIGMLNLALGYLNYTES